MNIDSFLESLYAEGCRNDAEAPGRDSMMFNITPSTGAFLQLLVEDMKPQRILELGTSNGYSTCWLARAAKKVDSQVDTVDALKWKSDAAAKNLSLCNLSDAVTLHTSDGGDFLRDCEVDRYDFVFLDSNRSAYLDWTSDLMRTIRFGLLVVDNATSHADEIADFRKCLTEEHGMSAVILPIGKGQMIVQPAS